jgi:hypothetical protein
MNRFGDIHKKSGGFPGNQTPPSRYGQPNQSKVFFISFKKCHFQSISLTHSVKAKFSINVFFGVMLRFKISCCFCCFQGIEYFLLIEIGQKMSMFTKRNNFVQIEINCVVS